MYITVMTAPFFQELKFSFSLRDLFGKRLHLSSNGCTFLLTIAPFPVLGVFVKAVHFIGKAVHLAVHYVQLILYASAYSVFSQASHPNQRGNRNMHCCAQCIDLQ
jgi:hypothetical protein